MMKDELQEQYCEWIAEQNILQAEIFEEENEILKNLASDENRPADWSTWCQNLCS